MSKAKKTAPGKPRAGKYDEKLIIKGRFGGVFKVIKMNKEENKSGK